jgi:[acyl-carrier-protein] S-malonyltransferase
MIVMTTALVFPGQGSQSVGMGQSLLANFAGAREVLQEVDEALEFSLSKVIAQGPEADLTRTENAQPAIMAVSLAAFRVMEKEMGLTLPGSAAYVAGHSLGEYSALTAAGTLSVFDCAKLLQIRGRSMQASVGEGHGAMAAIIGPELPAVQAIVKDVAAELPGETVEVANHNAPNQIVISGTAKGVERAMVLAKERGAKRAVALAVSAPFHCSLMCPAAEIMQGALERAAMKAPAVPLVANVTAAFVSDPTEIRRLLVRQVTGMVRWVDSVLAMQQAGVTRIVEIGHGQILSGLIKRIAPEIACVNVGSAEDLESYAKAA